MRKFLIILFCSLAVSQAQAQQSDTTTWVLLLNDGGEIMGQILSEDEWAYRVLTAKQGIILVPKYVVKEKLVPSARDIQISKFSVPNPHPTRYFYSPTAEPLKKGEGYIQSLYFVSAQMQYGFTDHLSAGVATTVVGAPILVSLKYGHKLSEKVSLAAGIQAGNMSWVNTHLSLGVGFLTATMGGAENSLSISGGYGFMRDRQEYERMITTPPFYEYYDSTSFEQAALFSLSGIRRISPKASLLAEVWYIPSEDAVFGGPGLRIFPGRKICWDFLMCAVISPKLDFFVIPGISATWKI